MFQTLQRSQTWVCKGCNEASRAASVCCNFSPEHIYMTFDFESQRLYICLQKVVNELGKGRSRQFCQFWSFLHLSGAGVFQFQNVSRIGQIDEVKLTPQFKFVPDTKRYLYNVCLLPHLYADTSRSNGCLTTMKLRDWEASLSMSSAGGRNMAAAYRKSKSLFWQSAPESHLMNALIWDFLPCQL